MEYYAKSIFDLIKNNKNIEDGVHTYICTKNNISLSFEIINYYNDTVFSKNPILGNSIPDTQMLILKFHKNLTIDKNVIITPQVRKKGFVIFCMDTLTNDGVISMTARGASTTGQDLYLYKNQDDTYEFIPATGANGGPAVSRANSRGGTQGNPGSDGTNRGTGGGGSGAASSQNNNTGISYASAGTQGTSYSGGTGGGAATQNGGTATAKAAEVNGGKGGDGAVGTAGDMTVSAAAGAGNPMGKGAGTRPSLATEGTGGLLIIFCRNFCNLGTISANGSNGGGVPLADSSIGSGGGASGGGSINIFYSTNVSSGTITVTGGVGGIGYSKSAFTWQANGGHGGNGTITLTKIDFKMFSSLAYNTVKEAILNNELINKIISFFE